MSWPWHCAQPRGAKAKLIARTSPRLVSLIRYPPLAPPERRRVITIAPTLHQRNFGNARHPWVTAPPAALIGGARYLPRSATANDSDQPRPRCRRPGRG